LDLIKPSLPVNLLLVNNQLTGNVLDYGSGKGIDVKYLNLFNEIKCCGYDPYNKSTLPTKNAYDFILCNYLIDKIAFNQHRIDIIKHIIYLSDDQTQIIITTRTNNDIDYIAKNNNWNQFEDGYITKSNQFQRGFNESQLYNLIEQALYNKQHLIQFNPNNKLNNFTQAIISKQK